MKGSTAALIFILGMVAIVAIAIFMAMSLLKGQDIEVLMEKGKYQHVIDTAGRLLEDDPDNLRYHELVVEAFIRQKKYPEAKKHFEYVVYTKPGGDQLCSVIGQFLGAEGQYQLASEWLKEDCAPKDESPPPVTPKTESQPLFFDEDSLPE